MEVSAPKRRRTSPRTSLPVDHGDNAQPTTPPDPPPGPATKPKRPSFASPTKASLARHNPDILQRRRPATRSKNDDAPAASRPTSRDSNQSESALLSAQLERHSETPAMDAGAGDDDAMEATRSAGDDPRSAPADASARSPGRKLGGGMAAKPRRTPNKPIPRPLPPPGPADEDVLNPFLGRALRRSGVGVIPTEPIQEEPELPPTPEHPDPEITTPPSGIHNTPSKRPRRSKSLAEKIRSSPLKQPPVRPGKEQRGNTRPEKSGASPKTRQKQQGHDGEVHASRTDSKRVVKPPDPDADKKKLRDSLLEEVAQLEADLAAVTKENERMRQGEPGQVKARDILDVLRRHTLPPAQEKADPTAAWLQAAMNPMAFLPFGKPSSTLSSLISHDTSTEKDEPPVSHHPIPMKAEEELPFLRAFTPLSFSSDITVVPRESANDPLLQKHSIIATSNNPAGIFAARIEMTVNTKTLAVTDLAVPRLDPAAMSELGPFIEGIVSRMETSSARTRNVSVLTWAMGGWIRVALRRAKFWFSLEKELGGKDALVESVARIRTRRKRKRRRKDAEQDDEDSIQGRNGEPVPRAELLPHLGRTSMDLDVPTLGSSDADKSSLRVQWRIGFDWTGEAQSCIGLLVGVPGKWHRADERGSLAGLPGLFDKLVHGGEDPASAVGTIVALLAGEQDS